MGEWMSALDLDAIEARANAALKFDGPADEFEGAAWASVQDVPALVARVRDLEAVVERARAIEVADRVDHSQHVGADGEPCGVPVSWKSRMGRDLARALEGATE